MAVACAFAGELPAGEVARANESVDQFLAALRQRQFFDEALDYLDLVRENRHVSERVKQQIPYEQALTLIARSESLANLDARETQLSKASTLFGQFLAASPAHDLANSAKVRLATILVDRGRIEIERAKQSSQKDATLAGGRKLFEQALAQFDAAGKSLDEQLEKLPKLVAPGDADTAALKVRLAGEVAQARLMRASVEYELAKSFEPTRGEYKKHLKAAAGSYAKIYEAYRTRAAGLWARLEEGRCYQEMGDAKQALGCYLELLELPATSDTRAIKTKSTRQAL
ncbi:MAG TPA: hypothetical protein VHV08_01730, partial [Pirellulales bacterium]|nr:hypothetical protein [Pirellulales bacterium]